MPGIEKHIVVSGKMSSDGEFDYRPELDQLKEAILAHLILNPVDEQLNVNIDSDANDLLYEDTPNKFDETIHKKVEESKIYIRSKNSDQKQVALEKIWDCFERLKTIYEGGKKQSVSKLIDNISHDSERIKENLEHEFLELTTIGNFFQIRHFETGTEPIPTDSYREYLYFRTLSLISYCMKELTPL